MSTLVIIPARGGSKGVPKKNLQKVGGKSLIARAVRTAIQALPDSACVVSTDCSYIKQVARAHGAAVFERPGSLADDNSPSELALLNVLNRWRPELLPDYVVFMQCTSPFTTVGDVLGTLDVVQKDGCGSALAVTKFHGFLWRASGESVMGNPARMRGPRQTNEQVYLESGSVYAFDRRLFMKEQTRFCGKTGLYISETPRFEIDTPEDLEQARKMVTEFYCD